MIAKPRKNFALDDQGGPLVEMAVLLLPFMVMIAMVIEGGSILWNHQISLKAARDTTRYLSRIPLLFDENCGLDGAVFTSATASAKTLGISGLLAGGPPLIANWTSANIQVATPSIVTTDPCFAVVQATASVDLPLPFAPIFQLFNPSQEDTLSFSVADRARWLGE
jgi:Flp pilus assembly protein TadG